jgi:predicted nucleotidyltransferase
MSEKMNITPLSMKILIFLARHPDQEFYVREIAKTIKKSVGGTHKALKSLRILDLAIEKTSGKNLYYRVNDVNPSVKNFKIFMTTSELHPVIHELKTVAEKIILFGSCAAGEDTADSDIDLFILTQETKKVNGYLKKKHLERTIQAVVVDAVGLVKIKEKDKAFYHEMNKGLILWESTNHE